jgi:DNA polymerase-1
MRKYYSDGFQNDSFTPDKDEGLWVYNGMDCCLTIEILHALKPKLNEVTEKVYDHALALQAPILEMECRGICVDRNHMATVQAHYQGQLIRLKASLEEIMSEGLKLPGFNFNSPLQMKTLFYEIFSLPKQSKKGVVTLDRKALEKFRSQYFFVEPIVNHILAIRDTVKKLGVLKTGIDSDGKMRTSYNIAGTDTGRLSSYSSAFGSGTNLQNITGELRRIFVPSPGKKLAYIDLSQAESRAVGAILWNLFSDATYLDACESGDLHTDVTRLCWTDFEWTTDPKTNKAIASRPFYRELSYRDASKRLGHGTNYYGQPPHLAKETRVPLPLVQEFQKKYFKAFPGLEEFHHWTRQKLIKDGWITSVLGRHRWFFGRRWDLETLRAAIAFDPQSSVSDYLNKGLMRVHAYPRVDLLLQVHDAIVIQYAVEEEDSVVPHVQRLLEWELPLMAGRSLIIPTDAQVGWNWAYATPANPNGMKAFSGHDSREFQPEAKYDFRNKLA